MKQVFFMAILLFASVLTLHAQYGGGYGGGGYGGRQRQRMPEAGGEQKPQKIPTAQEMAESETKQLTQALELTPEQVVKVKAWSLNYSQQRLELMKEFLSNCDH